MPPTISTPNSIQQQKWQGPKPKTHLRFNCGINWWCGVTFLSWPSFSPSPWPNDNPVILFKKRPVELLWGIVFLDVKSRSDIWKLVGDSLRGPLPPRNGIVRWLRMEAMDDNELMQLFWDILFYFLVWRWQGDSEWGDQCCNWFDEVQIWQSDVTCIVSNSACCKPGWWQGQGLNERVVIW